MQIFIIALLTSIIDSKDQTSELLPRTCPRPVFNIVGSFQTGDSKKTAPCFKFASKIRGRFSTTPLWQDNLVIEIFYRTNN